MNIVTKSDIKKFIKLFKAGINKGEAVHLQSLSDVTKMVDGTSVPEKFFVSLHFSCILSAEEVAKIVDEDAIDNEINDLLKEM